MSWRCADDVPMQVDRSGREQPARSARRGRIGRPRRTCPQHPREPPRPPPGPTPGARAASSRSRSRSLLYCSRPKEQVQVNVHRIELELRVRGGVHLRQERRAGDLLHDLAGERVERLQAPLVLDGDEPEPLELEGSREGQVRGIGSRGARRLWGRLRRLGDRQGRARATSRNRLVSCFMSVRDPRASFRAKPGRARRLRAARLRSSRRGDAGSAPA